jgi:hypothetical protein
VICAAITSRTWSERSASTARSANGSGSASSCLT